MNNITHFLVAYQNGDIGVHQIQRTLRKHPEWLNFLSLSLQKELKAYL
jgi:hypothetical protein